MAQQPPVAQLQDLPAFLLARIVRSLAVSDPRAAVSLACTCRLLAAVSADELLVFAPLCRELQKLQPATSCGGPSSVRRWQHRPHACAYVSLRLGAWLTSSLWRGAGDDASRRFAFFWKTDGGTVECAELDAVTCNARSVGVCRVGSCGEARARDSDGAMDVLRLDVDRCVLSVPPEQPVVSAVAVSIAGKCTSPVGSLSSNFALAYLEHTHKLVKASRRRRTGQQAPDMALLRVAPLAQVSLVLGDSRPHVETAASALDIAAGVTRVRCVRHERDTCIFSLYWLRGGRLLACCTQGGAAPRDVCNIVPP